MRSAVIDLSVIVTAHNEGLVAHKTILSIERALRLAVAQGLSCEVVISIDSGDKETIGYFERYEKNESYRILSVSFKDLSLSRNNAVKEARGKIVTFIDADDLISESWFVRAYEIASSKQCIVHPEYSITFGDDNLLWRKRDSDNLTYDTLCFVDNNLWDSPSMAKRKIYLQHPYMPNGNGFGYEDKQFHTESLAAGIPHVIAPNTVLFVRRKITGSMLRGAVNDRVTIAPSSLLSYERIKGLDIAQYLSPDLGHTAINRRKRIIWQHTKPAIWRAHTLAKRYKVYRYLSAPLRERLAKQKKQAISEKYPHWLLKEWRAIHKIDNTIFPAQSLLAALPQYNAENITPGLKYTQLIQSFDSQPDTLFFIPWLIKGGADMLFINYPTEIIRQHPDWKIAMLQTEQKDSVWASKLPKSIDFVDLFNLFQGLDFDTQFRLLATLIAQNNIRRIIIGNSQLAYDFVSRYETLIKRLGVAVYCFAFGEEFDDEGRLWGHIHTGIPRIYAAVHRIITDNHNTVNKLVGEYAFDPEKFAVHYQPTAVTLRPSVDHANRDKIHVLWASRICKQKRPDILMKVAQKLDPSRFIVDAYGQLEENYSESSFLGTNVHYRGAYNGIETIPTNDYDVFLYTSEGDGIPNILQEITASGLPIVASGVGGIGEIIITGKTGILVQDHNNINDYVAAIERLAKDKSLRTALNQGAQKLLTTQFSRPIWVKNIRKDFDR